MGKCSIKTASMELHFSSSMVGYALSALLEQHFNNILFICLSVSVLEGKYTGFLD